MNNGDALKALQEYYDVTNPAPDDEFKFTEALGYLIEETKNPKYMTELGWYYCAKKRFDLEIKYLEMAAEYGYLPAMEELGYMWYYGQHDYSPLIQKRQTFMTSFIWQKSPASTA